MEITKERVLALTTDPNFKRDQFEQAVLKDVGINIPSITQGRVLSPEDYANIVYELLIQLEKETGEMTVKYEELQ
jgi:hypothetical protein